MEPALSADRQRLLQALRARERASGHQIVARTLRNLGVTHVYAVGGAPVDATMGACARAGLRVVGARQQQGAVMMSLAHNYVAGALRSAVVVSAGPAITNCTTGLLTGHDNRWPLLVIGGRRGLERADAFQSLDAAALFAPIAWTAPVTNTAELAAKLLKAAGAAAGAPPGPAYLDVAEEALQGHGELPAPLPSPGIPTPVPTAVDAAGLDAALDAIGNARRPALLVGKGARWREAASLLREFVDSFEIPFACSPMGRGLLPDEHPLNCSTLRGALLGESDLVIVVGARLDWTFRFGVEISPQAKVIRIDVDPREAAAVLGRGIGLHGDASMVLKLLLSGLPRRISPGRRDAVWPEHLRARRASLGTGAVPPAERDLLPMSPYEWLAELRPAIPADAITVLDGNVVMTAAQRMLPVQQVASRLGPGTNGCMGAGIPYAIGAKMARPDLPVLAIVGDFSFGLSAIELETAVRHRAAIVCIVANNAGPGGGRRQLEHFPDAHPERVSRYSHDIRHDLVMTALGGRGCRVEGPGRIAAAVRDAIAGDTPACIDVLTNERTRVVAAI